MGCGVWGVGCGWGAGVPADLITPPHSMYSSHTDPHKMTVPTAPLSTKDNLSTNLDGKKQQPYKRMK